MNAGSFRREEIINLLSELESRLSELGIYLHIQIVGGAALLLHGLIDRATDDIDARYNNAQIVERVAREMAVEYGLGLTGSIRARWLSFPRMLSGWQALRAPHRPSNWQISQRSRR